MPHNSEFFNIDPYYDDYNANKKFLRVMYRPGYAVQARELTQSQTILQNQIESFGNHVFKDGSIVSESQVFYNTCQFVRIGSLTGYANVSINDFVGLTANVSGKNTIKVLYGLNGLSGSIVDTNNIAVFSQFLDGATAFSIGDIITANYNGTQISGTITGGTSTFDADAIYTPHHGNASLVGIDGGIRYIKGFFVQHDAQKIVPFNITGTGTNTYRQFKDLNCNIQLGYYNQIVTATEDASLNDPAYGSYNYAAPGADRFKIDLVLEQSPSGLTGDYTLIYITDGYAKFRSNFPEYSVILETIERRDYDMMGNFTIEDFDVDVVDHPSDDTKLRIKIGPGKAQVHGKEFINPSIQIFDVNKARTVETIQTSQSTPILVGSYVNLRFNPSLTASHLSAIDFSAGPKFLISSDAGSSFVNMGYLRLQNLAPFTNTSNMQANVYGIKLDGGLAMTSAKKLFLPGYTGSDQHIFEFVDSPATLNYPNNEMLLYQLSNGVNSYAVTGDIDSYSMVLEKSCTANISSGTNTFQISNFGLPFVPSTPICEFISGSENFRVFTLTGAPVTGSTSLPDSQTLYFNTAYTGAVHIFAKINLQNGKLNNTDNGIFKCDKQPSTVTSSVIMKNDGIQDYAYLNGDVDVYKILAITGTIGASSGLNLFNYFDLDNGATDTVYDWSKIIIKPAYYNAGITGVSVSYKKFDRVFGGSTNVGPYQNAPFIARSYKNVDYKDIPTYGLRQQTAQKISLTSVIDFRPDRIKPGAFGTTSSPENYGTTPKAFPFDVQIDNMKWKYYLPRTDKIVVAKDSNFRIVTGAEIDTSPEPPDQSDAMTIATITYFPYTNNYQSVSKYTKKNRRYTVKDLGGLENRIDRLEYYTTLSFEEKEAANTEIYDEFGLNKFKNGIFVDSFASRSNSDYNNRDHQCAIDPELLEARPRFKTQYVDYTLDSGSLTNTSVSEGMIMLNYTSVEFLNQSLATKAINVNPFNVVNYTGSMNIDPGSDDWIDVNTLPAAQLDLRSVNDGVTDGVEVDFGTIWNNWQTTWMGNIKQYKKKSGGFLRKIANAVGLGKGTAWTSVDLKEQRTGYQNFLQSETITRNIGERVVDVSLLPYMRAKTLTVTVKGLRPGVRVYPFFDGVDVSAYITPNPLIPNSRGELTATFNLPAGTFKSGQRLLRFIDNTTNNASQSTTVAEQIYRSQGMIKTVEDTVVSTRQITIRRKDLREERARSGVNINDVNNNSCPTGYGDPLAQTFLVDSTEYPNGIYLSSLDVFFKTKASNLPVYVQIRPTVNGYPSSSVVLPFSEVFKNPDQVNLSDDGQIATNFQFASPVYLQAGEYAIVVLSNSDEYNAWIAEIGQNEVFTGNTIVSQPYAGSLFKSQNSSTWVAEQTMDLKFKLNRCLFTANSGSATFRYTELAQNIDSRYTDLNGINVYNLNYSAITPSKTNIYAESTMPGGTVISSQNSQNWIFNNKIGVNAGSQFEANFTLSTQDTAITPMLDTQRTSALYVYNIIQNNVLDEYKDAYEMLSSIRGVTNSNFISKMRYLGKRVNLQDGFESTELDVYMSARLPIASDLRVYVRTQNTHDNTDMNNIPFEKMVIHPDYQIYYGGPTGFSQYVSSEETDYVDLRFTRGASANHMTSGITGLSEFKSFQVKVVMYGSPTPSLVPGFKSFRAIAT